MQQHCSKPVPLCQPHPLLLCSLSLLKGPADFEREDEEETEDSGEALDDSSSSPSSTLRNYPLTCKVLYSYKVAPGSERGDPMVIQIPEPSID